MEVSAFKHPAGAGVPARIAGRSPLLRLQSDERLVALTRRGSHGAYEALVSRYQPRLFAFCRHMVGSREDAEDVLQEVFAAAFNALHADERTINLRPWLYRIARNRCLNHLRRATAVGVDSMDIHFADHGQSTADQAAGREDFRLLLEDVAALPESQRTALLLREIDALSYDQIAEAMETTLPGVKSLLVRARVGLAEAAEARRLTCEEVRLGLGEWAEGLAKPSPAIRRHVRTCTACAAFRTQLKANNRALAAVLPLGPMVLLKKLAFFSVGSHAAGSGGGAASTGAALGFAGASSASGGLLSASVSAIAAKAAAGLAAAAIVTAGTIEVGSASRHRTHSQRPTLAAVTPAPVPVPITPPAVAGASGASSSNGHKRSGHHAARHHARKPAVVPVKAPAPAVVPVSAPAPKPAPAPAQSVSASTTLPAQPPVCTPATAATGAAPATGTTTAPAGSAPAAPCAPEPATAPTAPPTVTAPTPPPTTTTPAPPATTPPPSIPPTSTPPQVTPAP